MRIFAISDIHIDFEENERWLSGLSTVDYLDDVLILAGDICHDTNRLKKTLINLNNQFAYLFFVPGNHDLWIRDRDWKNSLEKFENIKQFCQANEIYQSSLRLKNNVNQNIACIVPLLSWYTTPEQGDDSLYLQKPGEDQTNRMWADNYYTSWPGSNGEFIPSSHFAALNEPRLNQTFDGNVISLSHFVPRQEAMFSSNRVPDPEMIKKYDRNPPFNFSRVAGSTKIERQIRKIGSEVHVYGHQHINRDREIDGVRYVSHCLGYPKERKRGQVRGFEEDRRVAGQGLKLVYEL